MSRLKWIVVDGKPMVSRKTAGEILYPNEPELQSYINDAFDKIDEEE